MYALMNSVNHALIKIDKEIHLSLSSFKKIKMYMPSYSTFELPQQRHVPQRCSLGRYFSIPTTKSLMLVILWSILIGFIGGLINSSPSKAVSSIYDKKNILLYTELFLYIVLAIAMMLYPLGGLLADVYFGRYKIIRASLITMAVAMFILVIVFVVTFQVNINQYSHILMKIAYVFGGGSAFLILALALAGFTSNIVQFGLDQLLDAPSNKLGAFVHLYVWANRLGWTAYDIFYSLKHCYYNIIDHPLLTKVTIYILPAGCFVALSVLVLLNCITHRMFNKERVKYNPYKMILKVLNFACKHKGPVGHPSAFAYCDEFKPSRLDYAKQRYGGPFTTSDVEDVKTLIRVFWMILSIGPMFVIVVPTSYYLFATFAIHTGTESMIGNGNCSADWILLQSGLLSEIVSTLIMPLYTWLLFSVLYRKNLLPKIVHRILFAALLFSLTPLNMLAVDLSGHALKSTGEHNDTCIFLQRALFSVKNELLNLHWSVLILPNLTKTLALDLIMASTFEFISAQSPHTMKGVLVGLLFAVRGLFQLIAAIVLFPFSLKNPWNLVAKETPQISCEFSYYLVISVIAFVGLVLFAVAARKYKYRKREEEPYSQSRVEEIYDRMLREREQRLAARIERVRTLNENVN